MCSGSRDWTVRVWDADTGSEVSMVKVEWNVVSFMKWIPGGDCVLQVGDVWMTHDRCQRPPFNPGLGAHRLG